MRRLAMAALAVCFAFCAMDILLRLTLFIALPSWYERVVLSPNAAVPPDTLKYQPHPYLLYVPNAQHPVQRLAWGLNEQGFAVGGTARGQREPGALRIAGVGASTTAHSWPLYLEEEKGPTYAQTPVEALDFGVPGWTTQESLVNLLLNVGSYQPDVVVVHHAYNDIYLRYFDELWPDHANARRVMDLSTPLGDRDLGSFLRQNWALYALLDLALREEDHRRVPTLIQLTTRPGAREPSPELAAAPDRVRRFSFNIERMLTLVEAMGARAVLMTTPWCEGERGTPFELSPADGAGLRASNDALREIAPRRGALLVDVAPELTGRCELYEDLIHLHPEGDHIKARRVMEALAGAGVVGGEALQRPRSTLVP